MSTSTLDATRQRLSELEHGRGEAERILAEAEAKKQAEREASEKRHADRLAKVANERLVVAERAFVASGGTPEQWTKQRDKIALDIATTAAINAGSSIHSGVKSLVDTRTI